MRKHPSGKNCEDYLRTAHTSCRPCLTVRQRQCDSVRVRSAREAPGLHDGGVAGWHPQGEQSRFHTGDSGGDLGQYI